MKPLLSIVVPTKDRYKYLKHLINLIESFNSPLIELVLQDNTADNNEILEFICQNSYPFIRYSHNPKQIPIYYNSDLAIQNSIGKYVCFIGDDDGVTRHIVDCVEWMEQNDIEVVVPSTISYHWPDFINSKTGNISGTLMYKPFTQSYNFKDPKDALYELMKKGFINRGELPLLYHGIVRRDILDKIFEVGGTYFPGPSPDIANGVALSLITKKYVQLDFPIAISGASQTHGGGIRKMKNKVANIEDVPFLPLNAKENWEKNIPPFWTGETVWPESAIKALRYMGRKDLIVNVNFDYMLARFVVFHLPVGMEAFKLTNSKLKLLFLIINMMIYRLISGVFRILERKFFNLNNGKKIIRNLHDIESVSQHLIKLYPDFKINSKE